jgi:hypothetical protein
MSTKTNFDLKQLISDIGEYMNTKQSKNVITSSDTIDDSNPNSEILDSEENSLSPENVSPETQEQEQEINNNKDTDWSDGIEPKVFNKEIVLEILEILRKNGFKDAVFDKKSGFIWNYYPPSTFVTLSFDNKYNKNKSFYISLINKFIVDESSLREVDILKEKFNKFQNEISFCQNVISEISEIYPIVY